MSTLPSLYTVSAGLAAIIAQLEDNGGELTPELEQQLTITEERFAEKAADYGAAILNLRAMADAARAEKDRLAKLQKFYENASKRLEGALCSAMDTFSRPKIETPSVRLFLRHSTATEIDDLEKVPNLYKTTKVEQVADKTAIKKAIQDGVDVPGAHLIDNVSLQIK